MLKREQRNHLNVKKLLNNFQPALLRLAGRAGKAVEEGAAESDAAGRGFGASEQFAVQREAGQALPPQHL